MHILHIYKDYYPVLGGIENHIRSLAEAQAARGYEVTVLVTHPGRTTVTETLNGVRVIKAGRVATLASTPISPALPGILRSLNPDLTHVQSPYPPGEMAQWAVRKGRPYVVSYQAEANRAVQRVIMLVYRPLFQRFLHQAGRVLVASPTFAETSPILRTLADRLSLVPIGTDTTRFMPHVGGSPRPPTVLFVGQLRHYKGVDDLLRAFSQISAVQLVIAGQGPMQREWQQLTTALQLHSRVKFLGNVPDVELPALYQSVDVFVLPSTSRAESFGIVLIEAMASGLPCVTTEIGSGNSFVVQDGITGFVVPPRSPEALARAVQRLVTDPGLRAQMGRAGRERALREFTLDRMLNRVEAIYQAVLSARPNP